MTTKNNIQVEFTDKGCYIPVRVNNELIVTVQTKAGKVTLSETKLANKRSVGVGV